jgi:hypothetical protein
MANHELYVVQGKTLDNIAGTMRAVLGVDKDAPIRFDEVATSDKTEQINTDIETQTDIIAQIQTALEGKAAGGGGTEEIENIIDQSGVLESTDGSVTDKVEQLIDKAVINNWLRARYLEGKYMLFQNSEMTFFPEGMDFLNLTTMAYMFSNNKNLTVMPDMGSTANVKSFNHCWSGCASLTELPPLDLSSCTDAAYLATNTAIKTLILSNTGMVRSFNCLANQCPNLETISTLDCSSVTQFSNWLQESFAVKNLSFVPETINVSIVIPSPVLTIGNVFNLNDTENVGSVQNIINGLATLAEGAVAQTLTLSTNLPLTEEQKQAITTAVNNKGWTLAFK